MSCPCGAPATFASCCGRFHAGEAPPTAVALMRARYSAFATHNVDFLLATGPRADPKQLDASMRETQWLGLSIEATEAGGSQDDTGTVTFSARFVEGKKAGVLRERSRFQRTDGRWRYVDGDTRVELLAAGRNDPCPCGSGLKRKSCHP